MSRENLELLYRYGQVYSAGDLDRCVSEFCAPDIEYHPAAEDPDAGTLRGRQAAKRFFEEWLEMFEGMRFETEDYIDVVDERVFVWSRWTGRGRASGVDADWHVAHIYTIRDGQIVRVEEYYDKAEALEVVGLRE
jgi:ketosteroid isomerase-like protein